MERPLVLELELARATDVADPTAFRGGHGVYVVRWQGGAYREATVDWDESLLADLAALQHERPAAELPARMGARLRRMVVDAGWAQHEAVIAEAVAAKRPVILELRAAAAELYALPWELLPVAPLGQPLGALPSVLVRYAWPEVRETPDARPLDHEGGALLFAWSAAGGAVPAGAHQGTLARAAEANALPFDPATDVLGEATLDALVARLGRARDAGRPTTLLHLLCHGGAGPGAGLLLSDEQGAPVEISGDTLARALAPFAGTLRFVTLCACRSGAESPGSYLGSAAQHLHRAGFATVLASRLPLSVRGSTVLCEQLYPGLLGGLASVAELARTTRRALALDPTHLDWASLQLYAAHESRPVLRRPYRGLLPFLSQHANLFFGRDAELAELTTDLRALGLDGRPRFLLVLGASGTGKSSLVMAGLGPALSREPDAWDVRRFRPGAEPLRALDETLASRTTGGGRLLLVADQLEELFTHTPLPETRESLLRRLWSLASDPRSGVSVVATLRVDFLARCDEITLDRGGLRLDRVACDDAHRLLLSQMDRAQLRRVIEGPAHLAGLRLEPGLAERLLDDVEGQPGALPLIQYTLDLLWQRRRGDCLTQEAYGGMGGVAGALSGMAEAVYDGLDAPARAQLRRLMVRLVSAPTGAVADTRQRVPLALVRPANPASQAAFERALAAVEAARLIAREEGTTPTIELAHEALLRRWERLRTWLREDQLRLGELAELEKWAAEWRRYGSLLETTEQLGFASRIADLYAEDLSPDARALVSDSRARVARRRRLDRWVRLGVGLAACVFLVLALVAWQQASRNAALREVAETRSRELQIESQRARDAVRVNVANAAVRDPTRGIVLLREAESPERSPAWRQSALELLHRSISSRVWRGHRGPLTALAARPDGTLATASEDGEVRLWSLHTGALIAALGGHGGAVLDVASSATDGRLLTRDRAGKVRLWPDAGTAPPFVLQAPVGPLLRARLSPDGQRVLTVDAAGDVSLWRWDGAGDPQVLPRVPAAATDAIWSPDGAEILTIHADGAARRWRDGAITATHAPTPGGLNSASYGPDGLVALVGRPQVGAVLLWSGSGARRTLRHDGATRALFSPDGRWLAVASEGPSGVRIWPTDGEGPARDLPRAHLGALALAWSDDSALLATGHADGAVQIWPVQGGDPVELLGHRGPVVALRLDETTLFSASRDAELRAWPLTGLGALETLSGLQGGAILGWSADGGSLAVADDTGEARLWRLDRPLAPERLPSATALAWSADGTLALGDADGRWRLRTAAGTTPLPALDGWVSQSRFSPDGRWLAVASLQGALRVMSATGEPRRTWDRADASPTALAWAPSGSRLVVAWSDGRIRVYPTDAETPEVVLRGADAPATAILWAETSLVTVHADHARRWRADGAGEAEILDPEGGPPLAASLRDPGDLRLMRANGQVISLDPSRSAPLPSASGPPDLAVFSPDGARWAAGFRDGHIELGGDDEVLRLRGHATPVVGLAFSPDGTQLGSLELEGAPRVWMTDPRDASLEAALWAATQDCATAADRQEALSLEPEIAQAQVRACEARVSERGP